MKYGIENIEPSYEAALDYIYSFVDFSLKRNFRYSPDQFKLDRMFALMKALGNPQERYPILHIAGTKGKGSVSALCASVLEAAGCRTGLYTSPHLEDYNQRIQINRQPIPHDVFSSLVEEYKPILESIPNLTFFEITTALAFLYFERCGVDIAVFEVGLGGRLDATNVCTPCVSVITSISYDHTAILGDTLPEIAGEKAGIIKKGIPVVVAPQEPDAFHAIENIAFERGAPLLVVGEDLKYARISFTPERQMLNIWNPGDEEPVEFAIALAGEHQVENAAVAYAALKIVSDKGIVKIIDTHIKSGFLNTIWQGRFEILQSVPPIILDCAHNRDSAHWLRLAVQDYFPGKSTILVFGASEDKDIPGMLQELEQVTGTFILVKSFHPRSADLEELYEFVQKFDRPVRLVPDVADAILEAVNIAGENDVILVTGSVFVVAGARMAWYKNRSTP